MKKKPKKLNIKNHIAIISELGRQLDEEVLLLRKQADKVDIMLNSYAVAVETIIPYVEDARFAKFFKCEPNSEEDE